MEVTGALKPASHSGQTQVIDGDLKRVELPVCFGVLQCPIQMSLHIKGPPEHKRNPNSGDSPSSPHSV